MFLKEVSLHFTITNIAWWTSHIIKVEQKFIKEDKISKPVIKTLLLNDTNTVHKNIYI